MSDYQGLTDIEFYSVQGEKTFLWSCRACNGTGKRFEKLLSDLSIWTYQTKPCKVCLGRGVVRLESPDVPLTHGACLGTGRARYFLLRVADSPALNAQSGYCEGCLGLGIVSLTGTIANFSGSNPGHDLYLREDEKQKPLNVIAPSAVNREVEILEHNAVGGWFTTPCRYCEGTGKSPWTLTVSLAIDTWSSDAWSCNVCKGARILQLTSPDLPVPHGTCRGTGRSFMVLPATGEQICLSCMYCHGLGLRSLDGHDELISDVHKAA